MNNLKVGVTLAVLFNAIMWSTGFNYDERGAELAFCLGVTVLLTLAGIGMDRSNM